MSEYDTISQTLSRMEALSPAGFACAFHIRFTAPEFLFQTYPKRWIDLYSERGYVMNDPTVAWGFENTGSIRWSALALDDPAEIFEAALEFGLIYGVTVSTEAGESRSVSSYSRSDREFTDAEMRQLEELAQALHESTASETGMSEDLRDRLQALARSMTKRPDPSL